MNRSYKVIWNQSLNCFMAVAEYAKSRGKSSSHVVSSNSTASAAVSSGARLLRLSALSVGMVTAGFSMQAVAGYEAGGGSTFANCTRAAAGSGTEAASIAIANESSIACAPAIEAIAIGANLVAQGEQSTVIGNDIIASSTAIQAVVIGSNFNANPTTSTGAGGVAIGSGLTTALDSPTANGIGSVAIGSSGNNTANSNNLNGAIATGNHALALMSGANASATNSIALGTSATANIANSVALGSGSTTAAYVRTQTGTVNGKTYTYAGAPATSSTVSIGTSGTERTLTNLAAGRVSATSTDSINGSQLFQTNTELGNLATNTASALGGGSAAGTAAGGITAPSYSLNNGTVTATNVGAALSNIDGRTTTNTTNIATNATNITGLQNQTFRLRANTDTATAVGSNDTVTFLDGNNVNVTRTGNNVTIGTSATPTFTSVTSTGAMTAGSLNTGGTLTVTGASNLNGGANLNNNKITGLAKGTNATDAVNFSQLAESELTSSVVAGNNTSVSSATTGNNTAYTVNAKKSTVSAGSTAVAVTPGTEANDTTNYAVDLSTATKASLVKADTAVQTVSSNDSNLTAVKTGNNVAFDFADAPVFTGQVKATGFDASNAKIVNVANGTAATDVATFGQLTNIQTAGNNKINQLGTSTAANLGGGAVYNTTTGAVSAPAYSLNNGTVTADTVGGALTNIDGRTTTNTNNIAGNTSSITNLQNQTFRLRANTDTATAVGSNDTVTFLDGNNVNITRNGNNVTIGTSATPTFTTVTSTGAVNAGSLNTGGALTVTGASNLNGGANLNNNKITGLANGTAATDAATFGQLTTANTKTDALGNSTATNLGGGATYNATTGAVSAPAYSLNNGTVTANTVGGALTNLDGRTTTNTTNIATNTADIAKGFNIKAGSSAVDNVKLGETVGFTNTDNNLVITNNGTDNTVNYNLAQNLNLGATGSVLTGNTRVNNAGITVTGGTNDTVLLSRNGLNNGNNVITNVANGVAATDAATFGQLSTTNTNVATNTSNIANVQAQANRGFNISADNSDLVNNEMVDNVQLGETVDFTNTDGNLVATVSNNGINYDLAENIDLGVNGSVTTGNTVTNNAGVRIDDGTNITAVTATGTNVSDGTNTSNYGANGLTATDVDGNSTVVNQTGLSFTNDLGAATGPSITAAGINAGDTVISNLGPGSIAAGSKDAVNGDQLNTTNTNVTNNTTAIGDINAGRSGIVRQDAGTGAITVGAATGGTSVNFANSTGGARTLSGVADGNIAANSTDAVNGGQVNTLVNTVTGQINATNANVTDNTNRSTGNLAALGGGAAYDATNNIYTQPIYTLDDGSNTGTNVTANNVGDALDNLDGRTTTNTSNIANVQAQANRGFNISADNSDLVNNETVDNVQLGETVDFTNTDGNLVATVSNNGINYDLADDISVDSITADDGNGNVTTLNAMGTNVTDGTNSSDYTANGFSTTDGTNTTTFNQAGLSFTDINGATGPSITAAGIDAGDTVISNLRPGSIAAGSKDAVTGDQLNTTNTNVTNNTNDIDDINAGRSGIVRQDAGTGAITVGAATGGTSVNFANSTGGARTLSGVADGNIAANSKEAINGGQVNTLVNTVTGQINATNANVTDNTNRSTGNLAALGGGAAYNATNNTYTQPIYTLDDGSNTGTNVTANNVGDALNNLDGRTTSNTAAINQGFNISADNGTADNVQL
ncbi:ESPR-type extended signal peptide-containing protein, partial [Psychrobacter alimentarius]|uniref:ESPR-type extended signal peptide-containing protein n=1 Tax=Psychrobacter alimentarius TaxID=261164 RepID=UPI003FD67BF5